MFSICTASSTFNNSTFCPHSIFMCFVWISEQTAIISLYNFNWLVCITEMQCVYCAVRTGCLKVIQAESLRVYRGQSDTRKVFFSGCYCFSLSVLFHQYYILIFIWQLLKLRRTSGRILGSFKIHTFSEFSLNFLSINIARLYIITISVIALGGGYLDCEIEGNRRMGKMCI